MIVACAIGTAQARQDRPIHTDVARAGGDGPAPAAGAQAASGGTGQGGDGQGDRAQDRVGQRGAVPQPVAHPSAAGASPGQPDAAATTGNPAAAAPLASVTAPPVAPPHAPDSTEGDRTALINQDVVQHPPQTAIASRDPSHLQTTKMKLGGLLDRSVRSLENNEVGRVIDVMTGDDGKPAALELDVGGFMGVGNRRIAVAWSLFDLSRTGQNDPLRVALSAAQVRSAPAMDDSGATPVVTGAAPVSVSVPGPPEAAVVAPALPPGPMLATPPAAPPVLPAAPLPPASIPPASPATSSPGASSPATSPPAKSAPATSPSPASSPIPTPSPPSGPSVIPPSGPASPVGHDAVDPHMPPHPAGSTAAPSGTVPAPHRADRTPVDPPRRDGEDRF